MIDIDELEVLYRDDKERPTGLIGRDHVLALISELRHSREAIESVREARENTPDYKLREPIYRILADYDRNGADDD